MPSSLGKILLNFLHILNLFMPLWYFVFKQQKVKNLKLEHKCPRTKLLEPRTIAYFSVFFTVEKNRREKRWRKQRGYLIEERDWERFPSCLWQKYMNEWKGEVIDKGYWGRGRTNRGIKPEDRLRSGCWEREREDRVHIVWGERKIQWRRNSWKYFTTMALCSKCQLETACSLK